MRCLAFSPLLVGVLSETKAEIEKRRKRSTFSPLLVGVLSETIAFMTGGAVAKQLSVPYWSGCSVKQVVAIRRSRARQFSFSPLLVGVLSETEIGE